MDIATTVEASAAAIGVLAMLGTGVFGLGKFQSTMDANTRSNEKLSDVIDGHLTWSQHQVDLARDKFAEHDKRISIVETRLEK